MDLSTTQSLRPGSKVYDKYQRAVPGEEEKTLIVLEVHRDSRADEYDVREIGQPLSVVADDWPPISWNVDVPPGYEPDRDTVVEAVFYESLDNVFLGAWVEWSPSKLKRLCELNDVQIYAYHRERLSVLDNS